MRRRWLVALALAAGCGGGSRPAVLDGAAGGSGDAGLANEVADGRVDGAGRGDRTDVNAALGSDAGDGPTSDADTGVHTDGPPNDTVCPTQGPTVTVGSGPVSGTLQGLGSNPAVSCHGGVLTQGPEAFFTLTLTEAMTVEVMVATTDFVDPLIAIRPGTCKEGISELACSDQGPADVDGGAPPEPTDDADVPVRRKTLRTPLARGTYTIVVDTRSLGDLPSASFTMTVTRLAPRPNATCSAPTLLASGTTVTAEPLDLAGPPTAVCAGGTPSSLYYTVGVPAGQRLTARATPRAGDRPWMPRIEAFSSCSATSCLAQGHLAAGSTQQLDWINNGMTWQLVYLAVSIDGAVGSPLVDLNVSVVDLFATCGRPILVKDGTVLTNQDLSLAPPASTAQSCGGQTDHALYYAATLLPRQQISAQLNTSNAMSFVQLPEVHIRESCDSAQCSESNGGGNAFFVNQSNADETVIIEVTPQEFGTTGAFELSVSIPPPPAGVIVTAPSSLVTTESGGTATFTVALASPPTADVTIDVASNTPTEGTASPATLRFTAANWRTAQTVTVTGIDDQVADGPRDYTVVTTAAKSTDDRYDGLDADDVSVQNLDNDPGIALEGAGDVVTSEAGMKATFGVSLNAAPTAPVTVPLSTSDVSEGTVSPAQVTFTAANWSTPQLVTVTGVDDVMVDGTQPYTVVVGTLSSTDTRYGGQNPPDVSARNLDDDQVPVANKLVSGNHNCFSSSSNLPIAVDRGGQLYIVLACEGGLWLTTSVDAGVTFTEPALIPGTGTFTGGAISFATGGTGLAYLSFSENGTNTWFLRTNDGGSTWSPTLLSNRQDVPRVAAGGKTVLLLSAGPDNSDQVTLSRSVDGGRTFAKRLVDANLDVAVAPDGKTAWLLELATNGALHQSTDAGATFTKVGNVQQNVDVHLIGNDNLFTVFGPLQIAHLADLTTVATTDSLFPQQPLAMAVDEGDGLTLIDIDSQNRQQATRIRPDGSISSAPRVIGPGFNADGTAAFSRKASAVATMIGNVILYTTVVW